MAARILMILTSQSTLGAGGAAAGSWLEELAAPYRVLTEGGCEVTLASIAGGPAPIDPASTNEPWLTVDGRWFRLDADAQRKLAKTVPLSAVDATKIDAAFLVGGAAVMWDFPSDRTLGELIGRCSRDGKVLGGVCHGVAGFLNPHAGSGLLGGRKMTCISDAEDKLAGFDGIVPFMPESPLRAGGAQLSFATEPFGAHVVRDGRMITGQNPASARGCGVAMLEVLG